MNILNNLILKRGDTLLHNCNYVDENGDPINLTDYGIRIQARASEDSTDKLFDLTIGSGVGINNPADGIFSFTLSAETTALFSAGIYVLDIQMTNPDGVISSSSTFTLEVIKDVTK